MKKAIGFYKDLAIMQNDDKTYFLESSFYSSPNFYTIEAAFIYTDNLNKKVYKSTYGDNWKKEYLKTYGEWEKGYEKCKKCDGQIWVKINK